MPLTTERENMNCTVLLADSASDHQEPAMYSRDYLLGNALYHCTLPRVGELAHKELASAGLPLTTTRLTARSARDTHVPARGIARNFVSGV